MKIAFDVKNPEKLLKPNLNDVMLFDGKEWYVTTKEELLKECSELLNNCQITLERLSSDNELFKKKVASQLVDMSEIIKTIYNK